MSEHVSVRPRPFPPELYDEDGWIPDGIFISLIEKLWPERRGRGSRRRVSEPNPSSTTEEAPAETPSGDEEGNETSTLRRPFIPERSVKRMSWINGRKPSESCTLDRS